MSIRASKEIISVYALVSIGLIVSGCGLVDNLSPEKDLPPEKARSKLEERSVQYSQAAFVDYAQKGDLEVVKLFVDAGMDINARNNSEENDTALMEASREGRMAVVRFLVDNGAEIDAINNLKETALMMAAFEGHLKIVEFLVEKGASIYRSITNQYWDYYDYSRPDSPLMFAAFNGHLEVVKYLVETSEKDKRVGEMRLDSSAMWAALNGYFELVKFLVKKGAETNPSMTRGKTILMFASFNGHLELVEYLLRKGTDIHIRTDSWKHPKIPNGTGLLQEYGQSALTLAIILGHASVVRSLLEHWISESGADSQDGLGRSVLMFAAAAGDMGMMRLLVENGAEINAESRSGTTALIYAADRGNLEAVRFLIENGADLHVQNDYGYTALGLAKERDHQDVIEYIQSHAEE